MSASRHDERPQGVTLHVLDFAQVIEDNDFQIEEGAKIRLAFTPYAMAERDGVIYVVCSEGVGWKVTDEEPLELDLFVEKPDRIAMFPRWRAILTPAEVRECVTAETVDLADLIRTFGSRLESNFWTWHRTLGDRS